MPKYVAFNVVNEFGGKDGEQFTLSYFTDEDGFFHEASMHINLHLEERDQVRGSFKKIHKILMANRNLSPDAWAIFVRTITMDLYHTDININLFKEDE